MTDSGPIRSAAAGFYDAHGEKLRYLVVGFYNTAVSYIAFALALRFFAQPMESATGWDYKTVALVLQWAIWVVMVVHSTATMKYFAFRSKGHLGRQIVRAYFVYLPAQGISSLILYVAMAVLGLNPLVGQAAAVMIATVFSYIGHKYFTFRVPLATGETTHEDMLS